MDDERIHVTRYVKLTPHNLRALLYDLGLEPGSHPVHVLYERYEEMCYDVDADPISKNAFGRSLTRQGHEGFIKSVGGVNLRHRQITGRAFWEPGTQPPTELDPDSRHPGVLDPGYSWPAEPIMEPEGWSGDPADC